MSKDEIEEESNLEERTTEKKKHTWGIPEYIKDEDCPPLVDEVAEALDMGVQEEPTIPLPDLRTLISLVGKRKNAIIILKFFYERNNAYSAADVSKALKSHMCEDTVRRNLRKLCKVGVLKAVRVPNYDKKTVLYAMANAEVVGYIVQNALNHISYILGRAVPYNRVAVQGLKQNKDFVKACKEFALTIDEAIDLLKKCPKIETKYEGGGVVLFSRRSQGYIPPEQPKVVEQEPEEV